MSNVKYSIAMCNYNMGSTIERALLSILDQIDDRFEILVVDDGSNDNSLEIITRLQENHPQLRLLALPRDPKRKLGMTRNISVQHSKGEYVILHLDCDDVFDPHIIDFVNIFHEIEKARERDFLFTGQQINIGKRDFLLSIGPYRNLWRGQDWDLWRRLVERDLHLRLLHKPFHHRLPKAKRERLFRVVYYTFNHMLNQFQCGSKPLEIAKLHTNRFFKKRGDPKKLSLPLFLYHIGIIPITYLLSLPKEQFRYEKSIDEYRVLQQENTGDLNTFIEKYNITFDTNLLSGRGKEVFGL